MVRYLAAAALAACTALSPIAACAQYVVPSAPMRVRDFVEREGVNTHIPYTDGGYANVSNIVAYLSYLGIDHVRDGINAPGQFGGGPLSSYVSVAKAGNVFTFSVGGGGSFRSTGGSPTNPSLDQRIGYIDQLLAAVPGSVSGVEGTNEINNQPIVFNGHGASGKGNDELSATLTMQRLLYSDVRGDRALRGVPVDYFTGYAAGSIPVGPDPYTDIRIADWDTQHPYPNGGQPPAFWVSRSQALGNETPADAAAGAPAVYTETGYSSSGGTSGGVDEAVQARYTLDLFLDTASQGILGTFLYELMDAYAPGSPQGDAYWGMYDYKGAPKPVATAIHNMNAILADKSASARTFSTVPLSYKVTGEGAASHHFMMQRSDGSWILALWDETPIWDASKGTEIAPSSHQEVVTISGPASPMFAEYDPVSSTAPVASGKGDTATLTLSDRPLFLLIAP